MIDLGAINAVVVVRAARELLKGRAAPRGFDDALRHVVSFAQTGDGAPPTGAIGLVIATLFVPPARAGADPMEVRIRPLEGAGADGPLAQLVTAVLAARGRARLSIAKRIGVGELAALTGLSTRHVRWLLDHGKIARQPGEGLHGPVSQSAEELLRERRIAPWGQPVDG